MRISEDEKKALIYSLSHQASLMELNADTLAKTLDPALCNESVFMRQQAKKVRDLALDVENRL